MNWSNISIGQYQKIISSNAKGFDLLSIVTQLTVTELENLPLNKLEEIIKNYSFLSFEPIVSVQKKWKGYKILDFKNKGGAGSMIDFLALLDQNKYIENLEKIMATICHSSLEEDFETKCNYFKKIMPITVALGVADFFFQNFKLSEKTIPFYLEQVKMGRVSPKILMEKMKEDLKLTTNGTFG